MNLQRPMRASILAKTTVFMAFFSLIPLFLVTLLFILINREFFWHGLGIFGVFSIVLLGMAYGFARHLTLPIRALMRCAERIAKWDFSTVVDIQTYDKFHDLAHA